MKAVWFVAGLLLALEGFAQESPNLWRLGTFRYIYAGFRPRARWF